MVVTREYNPGKRRGATKGNINRKKNGDNFYKMDEESIVTIREELLENFFSLAESHLEAIRRMIERLEDDQLETQL